MKRILCLLLALFVFSFSVVAIVPEPITALSTGYQDVLFSNGYRGFCLDRDLHGAQSGNEFSATDTQAATSNYNGQDVSKALKVLFTQSFEKLFALNSNEEYVLSNSNTVQGIIWHFTDNQYVWGEQRDLVDQINAYTGPEIPDHNYSRTLANGDVITFSFMVIQPTQSGIQDFFAYKITVTHPSSHSHDFSDDWQSDENEHWQECECGEKQNKDGHTGGRADCKNKAVCSTCNKPYGNINPDNHTGNTKIVGYLPPQVGRPGYTGDTYCSDCDTLLGRGSEIEELHSHDFSDDWQSDENEHWQECECGEKQGKDEHTYQTSTCIVCGAKKQLPPSDTQSPQTTSQTIPAVVILISFLSAIGFAVSLKATKSK